MKGIAREVDVSEVFLRTINTTNTLKLFASVLRENDHYLQ